MKIESWWLLVVVSGGVLSACEVVHENEVTAEASPKRGFYAIDMPPVTADRASTGGISFVDIDADGDPDLHVTNGYDVSSENPVPQENRLYINTGGAFERSALAGLEEIEGFSSGSIWADYDNDGKLDVFVANQRDQENVLAFGDGQGLTRTDISEPDLAGGWSYSVSAADADNDGLLDIYVSNGGLSHTGVNYFYRNTGDRQFALLSDIPPAIDNQASGGASWSDYDGDGDQDLVVANRTTVEGGGFKLALYRNDGDMTFTRVDAQVLPEDAQYPMSAAWGDIDNDGDQDLYVPNLFGFANSLYENNGDGTFRMKDGGQATTDAGSSYGGTVGDLDNDGDLDLIVANWAASSEIYLNDGSGFFSLPSSDEFRRAVHYGSSVALADYDIDGDLDFVIGNWPNHPGEGLEENVLIENRFADGNWLRVTLEGVTSNRSAIGARIELVTRADGESLLQVREVSAHSGWRSQNDLTQHFGLGSAAAVESLTVYWPSGAIQNVVVDGVNKRVSIIEE